MVVTRDWKIKTWGRGSSLIGTTHLVGEAPREWCCWPTGSGDTRTTDSFPCSLSDWPRRGSSLIDSILSHSGMDHGHGPFDVDAFRKDTWNHQVEDLLSVIRAINEGVLEGHDDPLVLFGHSRGGVACLLTAGRHADDPELRRLKGVITAASPADACRLDEGEHDAFLRQGYMDVPSSRTGQSLRIDSAWLREQQADPEGHDVVTQAGRVRVPVGILHGLDDSTVGRGCRVSGRGRGRAGRDETHRWRQSRLQYA